MPPAEIARAGGDIRHRDRVGHHQGGDPVVLVIVVEQPVRQAGEIEKALGLGDRHVGCTAALPQGAAGFDARRLFHCIVSLAHRTALCAYLGGPPHRHPRNLLVPPIIALPL